MKKNKLTERTDVRDLLSGEGARELGGDARETAQDSTDPNLSRREPPDRPTGWDKPWQEEGSIASKHLDTEAERRMLRNRRDFYETLEGLERWVKSGFQSWTGEDEEGV